MPNGDIRRELGHQSTSDETPRQGENPLPHRTADTPTPLLFQYTGRSSLTIHGFVSGKKYDFAEPGAILEVDPRDRIIMLAMPKIQQVGDQRS